LLGRELLGANGHGDGHDGGQTDGNGSDNEHKAVFEDLLANTVRGATEVNHLVDEDDDDEDDGDGDKEVADMVDDLLEVTLLGGDGDEVGGAADEGVTAGFGDDGHLLTLLDDGGRVYGGTLVLGNGKRLAGERRLVNLEITLGSFTGGTNTKETRIGRNDIAKTEDNNVTGNKVTDVDLDELAITPGAGLESEGLTKSIKSGLGLGFLDETDESVDEEQTGDNSKVGPVPHDGGNDHGDLDEISDGAGEVGQKLEKSGLLLFGEFIAAKSGNAFSSLGRS